MSGALFGVTLLALAIASQSVRLARPSRHAILIGLAGGAAIVAVAIAAQPLAGLPVSAPAVRPVGGRDVSRRHRRGGHAARRHLRSRPCRGRPHSRRRTDQRALRADARAALRLGRGAGRLRRGAGVMRPAPADRRHRGAAIAHAIADLATWWLRAMSARLAGGVAVVLGLALLAVCVPLVGRRPLYDGVVVTEPYRFLDPGEGEAGSPASFSDVFDVFGGQSPILSAGTGESPPRRRSSAMRATSSSAFRRPRSRSISIRSSLPACPMRALLPATSTTSASPTKPACLSHRRPAAGSASYCASRRTSQARPRWRSSSTAAGALSRAATPGYVASMSPRRQSLASSP